MCLPVSLPGLGEARERADGDLLHELVLAHAARHLALEPRVLAREPVARGLELELRAAAREHEGGVVRLRDVVGGAEREALLLALGRVHRRHEHHGDVARARVLAQAREHLVPVHPGHHHVEEHEIRARVGLGHAERALARARGAHAVEGLQELAEDGEVVRRVVDDQDGVTGHRALPGAAAAP
jgi:hypothetical protein